MFLLTKNYEFTREAAVFDLQFEKVYECIYFIFKCLFVIADIILRIRSFTVQILSAK